MVYIQNRREYDESTNTIVFLNPDLLNVGGTIVVHYTVLEEHPIETTYPLSEIPHIDDKNRPEDSFVVEINGLELHWYNNWIYSSGSNAIIFIKK